MCGHCKDCRWWEDSFGEGIGVCRLTYTENEEARFPITLAWACLREDDDTYLWTDETFGCVQFKAKDER